MKDILSILWLTVAGIVIPCAGTARPLWGRPMAGNRQHDSRTKIWARPHFRSDAALVSGFQRRTAASRWSIKTPTSTGLPRTTMAPPFMAAAFVRSSLYEVTKIIGGRCPSWFNTS